MSPEDAFVEVLGQVEAAGNTRAWGDAGRACGRFQWHPTAYLTWQPTAEEYGGQEQTWDWAFEQAVRRFYRVGRGMTPPKTDTQIAMAYHLHGQLRFTGWDDDYEDRWNEAVKILGL